MTTTGDAYQSVPHSRIEAEHQVEHRFRIGHELGKGAFGVVKRIEHVDTSDTFAMKIVHKDKAGSSALKSLEREVAILKRVRHEYIILLKEVIETPKKVFLIMELCDGGDLRRLLERCHYLPENNARTIMANLAKAVHYLHRLEIVHRDLKLENILIKINPLNPDDCSNIKITDFGLAVVKGTGPESALMSYCGTPLYMAPEILDNKTYTQQCDSWSLGVIAYCLLCGSAPFKASRSHNESELRDLIRRCQINFDEAPWRRVSAEAIDCVNGLLTKDPVNRLMSYDLLHHTWIQSDDPTSVCDQPSCTNVLKLMRQFRLSEQACSRPDSSDFDGSQGSVSGASHDAPVSLDSSDDELKASQPAVAASTGNTLSTSQSSGENKKLLVKGVGTGSNVTGQPKYGFSRSYSSQLAGTQSMSNSHLQRNAPRRLAPLGAAGSRLAGTGARQQHKTTFLTSSGSGSVDEVAVTSGKTLTMDEIQRIQSHAQNSLRKSTSSRTGNASSNKLFFTKSVPNLNIGAATTLHVPTTTAAAATTTTSRCLRGGAPQSQLLTGKVSSSGADANASDNRQHQPASPAAPTGGTKS